jgi:hypothetical protein
MQCVLRKEERHFFYYYYYQMPLDTVPSTRSLEVVEWEKYEHHAIRLRGATSTLSRHRIVLLPRGKLIDSS